MVENGLQNGMMDKRKKINKKKVIFKGYINNYWLKRTLKYYALMLVVFYFLLNSDYFHNHYSFFIFPLDFLGASYGEFYELSVFKFLIYNLLCLISLCVIFVIFFMFFDFTGKYPNEKIKRSFEFPINKGNKSIKWSIVQIFYIYLIPLLSANTIILLK